jgi:hypothetical protein
VRRGRGTTPECSTASRGMAPTSGAAGERRPPGRESYARVQRRRPRSGARERAAGLGVAPACGATGLGVAPASGRPAWERPPRAARRASAWPVAHIATDGRCGEELPDLPVRAARGATKGMDVESLKRRAQIQEFLG